ncbi:DNA-nicking Smr family endonuclease [Roseibium hamelinense]|uniref:DNA-nicking Smr family endonuclease n=2 Tax=Roseibium hamelinense TaxID=150831 RepID=A0A562SNH4_9HYPH|nr:DNA-nicking Smr family endonuclease [Roseibium hamelinense]
MVAKTLTPLSKDKTVPEVSFNDLLETDKSSTAEPQKTDTAIRTPKQEKRTPSQPPLQRLEHKHRKKLVRGVVRIDARIDLHGMTQHQAHDRLRGFLYEAQARGHKTVLVITGKGGARDAFMNERGVLRRVVPQWLSMPDMRSLVLGYEEAHVTHGGGGALYVRIRRRR